MHPLFGKGVTSDSLSADAVCLPAGVVGGCGNQSGSGPICFVDVTNSVRVGCDGRCVIVDVRESTATAIESAYVHELSSTYGVSDVTAATGNGMEAFWACVEACGVRVVLVSFM